MITSNNHSRKWSDRREKESSRFKGYYGVLDICVHLNVCANLNQSYTLSKICNWEIDCDYIYIVVWSRKAGIIAVDATHIHWTVNHNIKHTSSTYTVYPDQPELTSKL